jgi:hypothetical protein
MSVKYVQDTLTGEPVAVDMPAGKARSRLLAAIRTGKYSPEFAYRERSWVSPADIAALWEAGGNHAQAAFVRGCAELDDIWWRGGALRRRLDAAKSRPGPTAPIDDSCIRELFRAVGMETAAQMHLIASALTLAKPFEKSARPLTPGQVRTLTVERS